MPDDDRFRGEPEDGEGQEPAPLPDDEIPASVAFMEMMRQAAARHRPQPSGWADPAMPPRLAARRLYTPPEDVVSPTDLGAEIPGGGPESSAQASPARGQAEKPPTYEKAMEAQRVQRVERRKTRRRSRAVGVLGGIFRSAIVVVVAAVLVATIFTWWTPSGFIQPGVRQELSLAMATSAATVQPTALPTPNWLRRVGIVSGHRGPENDPGAVCPDGLKEADINFNVAQLVVRNLRARGYTVDLLDEFDPRLNGYQAAALLSIHSNTCQEWEGGEVVSGFNIAAAAARITARGNDEILVNCVAQHYQQATALQRREGATPDMTDYHTFREIHSFTPAAIIELGFMLADREMLAEQPDLLARGLTDGILCFMEPGALPTPPPATTGVGVANPMVM